MKRTIIIVIALLAFAGQSCKKDKEIEKIVEKVKLDNEKSDLFVGDSFQLTANVKGSEFTNSDFVWTTTDEKIATVSATGLVNAVKEGDVTITVEASNKTKATCVFSIKPKPITIIHVSKVELDLATLELQVEQTKTLTATVNPKEASDKSLTWKSLDESIATVSDNGTITAVSVGTTSIVATSVDGAKTAKCELTVIAKVYNVESISLDIDKCDVYAGDTKNLVATILPDNATEKNILWTSSNDAIAKVDHLGAVTAITLGEATITAKTVDGAKTATCVITVLAKVVDVEELIIFPDTKTVDVGATFSVLVNVKPEAATDKILSWTSSDESIATVDQTGKVTAIAGGESIITATSHNNLTATCKLIVNKPVETPKGFMISQALTISNKEKRYVSLLIFDAADFEKEITWTISDTDKVDFVKNAAGLIEKEQGYFPKLVLKEGAATGDVVTVSATMDGKTLDCIVTVNKEDEYIPTYAFRCNPIYVSVGKYKKSKYIASLKPYKPTNKKLHIIIMDTTIAEVTALGNVKGLKVGKTQAIVSSDDSGMMAAVNVEVR